MTSLRLKAFDLGSSQDRWWTVLEAPALGAHETPPDKGPLQAMLLQWAPPSTPAKHEWYIAEAKMRHVILLILNNNEEGNDTTPCRYINARHHCKTKADLHSNT